MAEEYNPQPHTHHHQEEPVESSDRGLFDFMKKKEEADKPVPEEIYVSEFSEKVQVSEQEEKKEHDHGFGVHDKLRRSDSSSSSSSDEEEGDEEEKMRKKKEKKSLKDKLKEKLHKDEVKKHGEKVEVDTAVPIEKIHVEEVVYSEPSHPVEEKKGMLDKIKDKLPGQHKKPEDVATPLPPPASVAPDCEPSHPVEEKKGMLDKIKDKLPGQHKKPEDVATPPPPPAPECEAPEHEKKGFLEKIKDKLPGFHHKAEEEEKKEKEKD